MYRIMIVDDEPLILAGIASLLNWEEYQCRCPFWLRSSRIS